MNEQVGRYQVLGKLGRGAMGVVYLADDPKLNRKVAIKTVELVTDDPSRSNFLRERLLRDGRAAAGLSHANIVSVYDVLEEEECGYLVMEYIAGESLAARLARTPRPEIPFVLRILREMASALDYTHGRGIIHRDIKPANVMIDTGGAAKIMDFGIARITDTRTNTPSGMVMGTLEYMAPEQIKGEAVDGRADQFSLAAVAYEMLTGSTIFGQLSFATLAYKLVNEMPPPLRTHNPEVLPAVDEVVGRALRKAPDERFATCGDFVAALDGAFTGVVPVTARQTQAIFRSHTAETVDMSPPTVATRVSVPPDASISPAAATEGLPPVHAATLPISLATGNRSVLIGVAGVLGALVIGGVLFLWKPWIPAATLPVATPQASSGASAATPVPQQPNASSAEPPKAAPPATPVQPADLGTSATEPAKSAGKAANDTPPAADTSSAADPPEVNIPRPAQAALREGEAFVKADQYPAAIQSFNKAIELRPDFIRAMFARGAAYLHLNRPAEAFADYNQLVLRNPHNAVALAQRGICHARLRDDEAALEDFNKALQIRPELSSALNGRGLVYTHRRQYQKAIHDFTEAIRVQPGFGSAYLNRANVEETMGNHAASDADSKKGKELNAGKSNDGQ